MSSPSACAKPRLLITGALGRLAVETLNVIRSDFDCVLTDKAPRPERMENYVQADLTDFSQVDSLMEGVDIIAHFAIASFRELSSEESPGKLSPFDEMTMKVNLLGTQHLFAAARRRGVKRIVYLSSMTVYFGELRRASYDRSTPLMPQNLYACTKLFGENLADVYHRKYGISAICLRVGQPYPSNPDFDDLWRTNKRGRTHYIAIQDVVQAVKCALTTEVPYGIYNIVSSSDNPRVDLAPAREIGYRSQYHFCDEGLLFNADGIFPAPAGPMVTHLSTELPMEP